MIIHDDIPRINWILAVVEGLITGLDGITRAAEIRTAGGKTNRPTTRLFPLEINVNEDQDTLITLVSNVINVTLMTLLHYKLNNVTVRSFKVAVYQLAHAND